jgi:NAD(P)H dehydrogenase (quinone)
MFRRARLFGPIALVLAGAIAAGVASAQAPQAAPATRVLVAYDSVTGATEQMARAAAEGVRRVPGALAAVKRVGDVTKDDLARADGILLASPTYYANIPGRTKTALDDWAWRFKVDFTDKVGGALATGGGSTAGKEHVVVSLLLYMLNNRMVVAGPLYEDEKTKETWGELGATAMTGPLSPGVDAHELDAARRLGERVARLAAKLKPR